jgi:hypothetical protein
MSQQVSNEQFWGGFWCAVGLGALWLALTIAANAHGHRGGGYVSVIAGNGYNREVVGEEWVGEDQFKFDRLSGAVIVGLMGLGCCYAGIQQWRRPKTRQQSTVSQSDTPATGQKRWLQGGKEFKEGMEYFRNKELDRALQSFDSAIENGYCDRVYGPRGICVQSLDFNFDAIDDLDKAIAAEPYDSNLWHVRSMAKGSVGDFSGQTSDLNEAIRIARNNLDPYQETSDEYFKELGYENLAAYYVMQILVAGTLRSAIENDLPSFSAERRLKRRNPLRTAV